PSALSGSVHVLLLASAGQSRAEKVHLGIPTHTQGTWKRLRFLRERAGGVAGDDLLLPSGWIPLRPRRVQGGYGVRWSLDLFDIAPKAGVEFEMTIELPADTRRLYCRAYRKERHIMWIYTSGEGDEHLGLAGIIHNVNFEPKDVII